LIAVVPGGQLFTQAPLKLKVVAQEVQLEAIASHVLQTESQGEQFFPFKKVPLGQLSVHTPFTIATGHVL
jgi:hypothetical protein